MYYISLSCPQKFQKCIELFNELWRMFDTGYDDSLESDSDDRRWYVPVLCLEDDATRGFYNNTCTKQKTIFMLKFSIFVEYVLYKVV